MPGYLHPWAAVARAEEAAEDEARAAFVNLDEEETPDGIGHTKRDHVKKIDAELIDALPKDWVRLSTAGVDITQFRPAEGTFLSRESVNDFVNRTLEDNKETVTPLQAAKNGLQ